MRRQGRVAALLLIGVALEPGSAVAQDKPPSAATPAPPQSAAAPSAAAPTTPPATTPSPEKATPEAPPNGPPPQYYVEEPPRAGPEYEEPPPPLYYEPTPPPPPAHGVPRTAFWAGVRLSWLAPFGNLWTDGFNTPQGIYKRRRSFADYASSGPGLELNAGARLGRRYNVFALWEHATLGTGSLDPNAFGGQQRGAMNLYGVGVRYSADPSSVGLALELALGYRDFHAYWADGTTLNMTEGWLDARMGIGVDIRLSDAFSLSPMFTFAGGSFGHGQWTGRSSRGLGFDTLDDTASYNVVGFSLGGHVDVR